MHFSPFELGVCVSIGKGANDTYNCVYLVSSEAFKVSISVFNFQVMVPEAFAIVMAPTDTSRYAILM